ncbi:hypothetical protein G9C85_15680 [Halorubellus sp. JP-L1]|uniref:hypothetical protein n=1 Tax=Halorubellus sp. JP-L1 TaxID=2715753 RepID=UPI0014080BBB|nr:hypothetical protein [Halorubellus sp. JP-L1]NHN43057.1 hypothetical protein [Halorubellus sp. JP-L1]
MDVDALVSLLAALSLGVFGVGVGVVQTWRAIVDDQDSLYVGRFRHVFAALDLEGNDAARRVLWLFCGPLCALFGLGYLAAVVLYLFPSLSPL